MNQKYEKNTTIALLSYIAICVIWGTTYYAISAALKQQVPPFILGVLRFLIAGCIILLLALFKRQLILKTDVIFPNLLLGAVMMGGGQGLLFWAQQHIASGYAAIIEASLPLWFVLLDSSQRRSYLSNHKIIIGLVIGFYWPYCCCL